MFVLVDLQSLADDVPTTPLETRIQLLTRRLLKGKHASLTAAVQLPILGNSSSRLTIQLTISNSQSTQPNSSVRCSQHAVNEVVLSGGMGASQQEYKACPACGHYSTKLHIDSNCSTCAITKAALPETQTRVLSAILASIAMHIMTATAARSKSKAAGASEAQQLLPWREWAVYVLTEDVDLIGSANVVRPSFESLLAALASRSRAMASESGTAAAAAAAAGTRSGSTTSTTYADPNSCPPSLLDMLLAPPWVTVSEAGAMETASLERTVVFLKHWFAWLQQHKPEEAAKGDAGLSNQGYMMERRKAGLQSLLEGLLAADPVFSSVPRQRRLELFLVTAGIKGTPDQALTKLDNTIRIKPHLTTHLEACAYCGLTASKLKHLCKVTKGGSRCSAFCKCRHCLVAMCVPCMLASAGLIASADDVLQDSIGEEEAAQAASQWPDGLCPWCQQCEAAVAAIGAAAAEGTHEPAGQLQQVAAQGPGVGADASSAGAAAGGGVRAFGAALAKLPETAAAAAASSRDGGRCSSISTPKAQEGQQLPFLQDRHMQQGGDADNQQQGLGPEQQMQPPQHRHLHQQQQQPAQPGSARPTIDPALASAAAPDSPAWQQQEGLAAGSAELGYWCSEDMDVAGIAAERTASWQLQQQQGTGAGPNEHQPPHKRTRLSVSSLPYAADLEANLLQQQQQDRQQAAAAAAQQADQQQQRRQSSFAGEPSPAAATAAADATDALLTMHDAVAVVSRGGSPSSSSGLSGRKPSLVSATSSPPSLKACGCGCGGCGATSGASSGRLPAAAAAAAAGVEDVNMYDAHPSSRLCKHAAAVSAAVQIALTAAAQRLEAVAHHQHHHQQQQQQVPPAPQWRADFDEAIRAAAAAVEFAGVALTLQQQQQQQQQQQLPLHAAMAMALAGVDPGAMPDAAAAAAVGPLAEPVLGSAAAMGEGQRHGCAADQHMGAFVLQGMQCMVASGDPAQWQLATALALGMAKGVTQHVTQPVAVPAAAPAAAAAAAAGDGSTAGGLLEALLTLLQNMKVFPHPFAWQVAGTLVMGVTAGAGQYAAQHVVRPAAAAAAAAAGGSGVRNVWAAGMPGGDAAVGLPAGLQDPAQCSSGGRYTSMCDPTKVPARSATKQAAALRAAAAAAVGAEHSAAQSALSLLQHFSEQEQEVLMKLMDVRALEKKRRCSRRVRFEQQQQPRDQATEEPDPAAADGIWWQQQEERIARLQQDADCGISPAADPDWPWVLQARREAARAARSNGWDPAAAAAAAGPARLAGMQWQEQQLLGHAAVQCPPQQQQQGTDAGIAAALQSHPPAHSARISRASAGGVQIVAAEPNPQQVQQAQQAAGSLEVQIAQYMQQLQTPVWQQHQQPQQRQPWADVHPGAMLADGAGQLDSYAYYQQLQQQERERGRGRQQQRVRHRPQPQRQRPQAVAEALAGDNTVLVPNDHATAEELYFDDLISRFVRSSRPAVTTLPPSQQQEQPQEQEQQQEEGIAKPFSALRTVSTDGPGAVQLNGRNSSTGGINQHHQQQQQLQPSGQEAPSVSEQQRTSALPVQGALGDISDSAGNVIMTHVQFEAAAFKMMAQILEIEAVNVPGIVPVAGSVELPGGDAGLDEYQASPEQQQPRSRESPEQQQPGSEGSPGKQQLGSGTDPNQQQPGGEASPEQHQPNGLASPAQQQPDSTASPEEQQLGSKANLHSCSQKTRMSLNEQQP